MVEVLLSNMLDRKEAHKLRKQLSEISPVSYTHQPSDDAVIAVMHFTQAIAAGLTSQPFLTISAFASCR
jgi:hypothetical protein